MRKYIAILMLALPLATHAANPAFTNLTDADMKDIAKGMGANFTHNSMMGASKLGTVFGFQFGVTAAQTAVPDIDDIAKRSGGGLKNLYNAGMMGAVGIPFGISFEAVVMPSYKSNGAKAEANSYGLKWNINDVIPILPVNLAIRGIQSSSELSFDQASVGKVTDKTTVTGVQLLFSPMLPVIEPYVGVGQLEAKNELSSASGSIFSAGVKDSKTVTGTQFLAGAEVSLLVLKLGAEYSQAFGNSRYGFKLSFGF